jgi:hypothetical protein
MPVALAAVRAEDGLTVMAGGLEDQPAAGAARARGRKLGHPRFDRFLDWLAEDQAERGMTDTDYAAWRGLSRPHYVNAKAGRRHGLSRAVVEGVCKRHDDARDAYIALCLTRYRRAEPIAGPDAHSP